MRPATSSDSSGLVTFTGEILNGKHYFLCSGSMDTDVEISQPESHHIRHTT